ncbi:MAG: hypothetical protein QOI66_5400 [Myxococcales bacterium]|jgi:hypothetical protein|nr:hypothetical protein [Myxococcales bacterium]
MPSSGQSLRGSLPTTAGWHWPALPGAAQVKHGPWHALPQQTPSTQNPLLQSVLRAQRSPVMVSAGALSNEPSTIAITN